MICMLGSYLIYIGAIIGGVAFRSIKSLSCWL